MPLVQAENDPAKDALTRRYEQAMMQAGELNVFEYDMRQIVPRLQSAAEAVLKEDFSSANRILDETEMELGRLEKQRKKPLNSFFHDQGLEIFRDLIFKSCLLAILGYGFAQLRFGKRIFAVKDLPLIQRFYILILCAGTAFLITAPDFYDYGESVWAFLDIQLVFINLASILGGPLTGFLMGVLMAGYRMMLSFKFGNYAAIALAAGILGVFLSRPKNGVKLGFLTGLAQGAVIYLPLVPRLPLVYGIGISIFTGIIQAAANFVFLGVASSVFKKDENLKKEKEYLRTRIQFLQAQINPHFMYNALNAISAVCSRENAPSAKHLVLKLADFMRGTFRHAEGMTTLAEELEHMDAYLEIEKARFGDCLQLEKKIDLDEKFKKTSIPSLSLQPFVENAVKHGFSKLENAVCTLRVQLKAQTGGVQVLIEDTGAGMPLNILQMIRKGEKTSGGIGIQNALERLRHHFGSGFKFEIDSQEAKGTIVRIFLPCSGNAAP